MTLAHAPGKVVLSGAYVVLDGAPAIVSAADRYVTADSSRPASFVAPEVRAALGDAQAPAIDASALRSDGKKLGLGSSAAIVVASLAAVRWQQAERAGVPWSEFRNGVLRDALSAHRAAQGGGSGVDVVTSALGGTLVIQRGAAPDAPVGQRTPTLDMDDAGERVCAWSVQLPAGLVIEVWSARQPASTAEMVRAAKRLAEVDRASYEAVMAPLHRAARSAVAACCANDAASWIAALDEQQSGLAALGRAIQQPVVTQGMQRLHDLARQSGGVVVPAGAGGGDICTYAGTHPPSAELLRLAATLEYDRLDVSLGASGVDIQAPGRRSP